MGQEGRMVDSSLPVSIREQWFRRGGTGGYARDRD
jgi:hypothetical protein